MEKEIIRKIQLVELEIGKEIKRICEKHGIKYFLDGGSLLGAIRHNGFIPWDDDMDFGMVRSEFNKFINVAKDELNEDYFLQTWETDSSFPFEFAKIRKKGTLLLEASYGKNSSHNEIWVDVFPYDVYPNGRINCMIHKYKVMKYKKWLLMKNGFKAWNNHKSKIEKLLVRIKYLPALLFSSFFSVSTIHKKMQRWLILPQKDNTVFLHDGTGPFPYGRAKVSKSSFEKYKTAIFEDESFSVPAGYETVLTELYGDYMKLPPENKRVSGHTIVDYKV